MDARHKRWWGFPTKYFWTRAISMIRKRTMGRNKKISVRIAARDLLDEFSKGIRVPVKEATLPPPMRKTRKYSEKATRNTTLPPAITAGMSKGSSTCSRTDRGLAPRFLAQMPYPSPMT